MTALESSSPLSLQLWHQVSFRPEIAEGFPKADRVAVLITSEFEGVFKNGGVGTYYRNLAHRLAQAGWQVIVVLCMKEARFAGESAVPDVHHIFSLSCLSMALTLTPLQEAMLVHAKASGSNADSLSCLFYVQAIAQQFPQAQVFVEFHEMLGLGYDTVQAQKTGLMPPNCIIGLTMHSGHEWIYQANEKFVPHSADWFEWVAESERLSFEQADLCFHPSHFLKGEVETYHWNTAHAILMPNYITVLPEPA